MTGKTTLNKTEQRKAISRTFSLVKNGSSITDARKIVAEEVNVSPNTLWVWQRKLNMVTPTTVKTVNLIKSNGALNKPSTTRNISTHNVSASNITLKSGLEHIFQSLLTKNGDYSNQDANALCKVANTMLNRARYDLTIHKYSEKMSKRDNDKAVKNLLI